MIDISAHFCFSKPGFAHFYFGFFDIFQADKSKKAVLPTLKPGKSPLLKNPQSIGAQRFPGFLPTFFKKPHLV